MRVPTVLTLAVTAAIAVLATPPAVAQGNWQPGDFGSARVRLGLFMPNGGSDYWHQTEDVFTGKADDLEDLSLGFDYIWRFGRQSGLMFSTSFFDGKTTRAYRDYVDQNDHLINHSNKLQISDLTAAWVLEPGGHGAPVRPYFGIGGGLAFWDLSESGEFINFADPDLPIVFATYSDDGTTLEGVVLAGVEVAMSRRLTFVVEGRYRWAEDDLSGDFADVGSLDLSGLELSGGLSWNF